MNWQLEHRTQILSSAQGLMTIGLLFVTSLLVHYAYKSRQRSLKFIRGPPSPSWLVGNEYDLVHQLEANKLQDPWANEYGAVFRYSGCFGEDILHVADPKALQHIFHASSYHYPKAGDTRNDFRRLFGKSIVWAEGNMHQRHRKALNPAFSASQLKMYLSVFQRSTQRLVAKWQNQYSLLDRNKEEGQTVDMTRWISRLTLDIIGETSFDYDFQALEDSDNRLTAIMKMIFSASVQRSKLSLLVRAFRRNLIVDPAFYNPLNPDEPIVLTKEDKLQDNWLKASKKAAEDILRRKAASGHQGVEEGSKDILSILVRSNSLEDPKKRLDDEEVLAQMSTMILAGHETTGHTAVWLLYALAQHPEQQRRILEEIQEVRKRKVDAREDKQFTPHDYDSMPFFNAVIKEALRLYPTSLALFRFPDRDDVIPLSESIISASGDKLMEIPVKKGQRIDINVYAYNRLKSVWGEDADTWNPERFLDGKKGGTLGVFANLMTFSAGVRGCIGWRFALLELQSILEGLICAFEFSLDPAIKIFKAQAAPMAPMIVGREKEGLQMPLTVKPRISTWSRN
ncbi:hypothetical protein VKT23_006895 [Stygiomarasmius scandens]|uniref:Cytochrome P450 n=1 Tax=Marasmiellus scandens TaxID=2682957 RepID=A0ABR1JP02_9AGAR